MVRHPASNSRASKASKAVGVRAGISTGAPIITVLPLALLLLGLLSLPAFAPAVTVTLPLVGAV